MNQDINNRFKIKAIKKDFLDRKITFEQAKEQVEVILVDMNEKGAKIAKKHGRRFYKFTFTSVFR